ncbi:lipopolysaccharide biosynthesis protein [uncultured Modestobacter sp.]|uniref:lipopolysaccharide biosynthesis protein n=1 Tax=uncultured Modestobacter sp. TaxID=380048 RepID=UPI002630328B|nr:hypothetical protein [uncultured Modestobacter sp.]
MADIRTDVGGPEETATTTAVDAPAPAAPAPSAAGWSARVRAHLAEPFFRNAYALMINTGLTGVLGLLYWLFAARHYDDADAGRGSTAISVLMLLSGLVAFNVSGSLNRFLPASGRSVRQVVLASYLLSAGVVLALAVGFLATLDLWGPSFDLFRDPTFRWWFLAAVVVAAVFTVQDGVLTGLRSSVWVPVKNVSFGVLKLVLLVTLASVSPEEGLFLSWVLPMAIVLIPTNGLIFGRLLNRHLRAAGNRAPTYTRAEVRRFFAGDYLGAVIMFATVNLAPVMVAAAVVPEVYAYFYVVWVIGTLLDLVAIGLGTSLSVEGVYDRAGLAANCRAALTRALLLLLVAVVVVALTARPLLRVFGENYVNGALLLFLLVLSTLPRAVTEIWVGVLRVQGRAHQIVRVQAARGLLMIGAVFLVLHQDWLADHLGVSLPTTVGLAVLLSQVVVASAVLLQLRAFLREPTTEGEAVTDLPDQQSTTLTALPPSADGPGTAVPAGAGLAPTPDAVPDPAARRQRRAVAGLWSLTALAVPLFAVPLAGVRLDAMNGLGLVSVLPVASLVGVALLTVAFIGALSLRRARPLLLGTQLVVLVVLLHGVTTVLEAAARFPISYVHAGFVEFITRTGTVAPNIDGRFSWPGFFALFGFLVGEDAGSLQQVMTFTPLVSNLLYLLPLALLLRSVRATWRARWFALWLFASLNWVGQDYFSPQGATYLLYLVFVAVLVTWFRPQSGAPLVRLPAWPGVRRVWGRFFPPVVPGTVPPREVGAGERAGLLLLLVGVFVAATVSHQLTPFLMLFVCAALVVVGRNTARGLPLLLAVLLGSWISFMAATYWSGNLEGLLSGLGDLTGNLTSSVSGRAQGGDADHQLVVRTRIAFALVVFGLAAVGVLRRRLRGFDDRVLLVLLVVPFSAFGLQDYGGEISLRIYFFALPAACCLMALAFFPRAAARPGARALVAAGTCALVLAGGFFVARYGNEAFERIRPAEIAAVEEIYQQDVDAAVVLFPDSTGEEGTTPFSPLGSRDVERVSWNGVQVPRDASEVEDVVAELQAQGAGAFLLTTRGLEASLQFGAGYPAGWGEEFRQAMAASPGIRVVTENDDAVVYAADGTPDGEAAQPVTATGAQLLSTPWTPLGVVLLVLLVVVLGWRELRRVRAPGGVDPVIGRSGWAALPLLLGLAAVVVERLLVLGS